MDRQAALILAGGMLLTGIVLAGAMYSGPRASRVPVASGRLKAILDTEFQPVISYAGHVDTYEDVLIVRCDNGMTLVQPMSSVGQVGLLTADADHRIEGTPSSGQPPDGSDAATPGEGKGRETE